MKGSVKAALVGTSLASHLSGYYIVGATSDEWLTAYKANLPSILFVSAVALLVVNQNLAPAIQCPFPPVFKHFYNFLGILFMTNMALRLIWLPLSHTVVQLNTKLAKLICHLNPAKKQPLSAIENFLECPKFQTLQLFFLAGYVLWVVVNSTGAYDRIVKWIEQMKNKKCEQEPVKEPEPVPPESGDSTPGEEEEPPRIIRRSRY